MPLKNLMLGEAGRLRVASELMIRGYHVFLPTIDDGIDLFTECGLKIQVKTSTLTHDRYYACFRHWSIREGKRTQKTTSLRPDLTHLVLYGVEDDCFWIIPRSLISVKHTISVSSPSSKCKSRTIYNTFLNVWDSLKAR